VNREKITAARSRNLYRSERYCGAYQRVIDLPTRVEKDKTEAAFDKGILTVTLPKVEKVKKKQIKIKVE
jgi:HSP20 family protein